jgi:hypothetical protein
VNALPSCPATHVLLWDSPNTNPLRSRKLHLVVVVVVVVVAETYIRGSSFLFRSGGWSCCVKAWTASKRLGILSAPTLFLRQPPSFPTTLSSLFQHVHFTCLLPLLVHYLLPSRVSLHCTHFRIFYALIMPPKIAKKGTNSQTQRAIALTQASSPDPAPQQDAETQADADTQVDEDDPTPLTPLPMRLTPSPLRRDLLARLLPPPPTRRTAKARRRRSASWTLPTSKSTSSKV